MQTPGPIGTMIERYEVEQLLGSGGMGAVYVARHTMLGQRFAIKLLPAFSHDRLEALARFEREARAAASVKHPHVVQVTDLGTTPGGRAFIVMELLEGVTLDRVLRSDAPLEPTRAIRLVSQILDGVGAAHAAGIVHRDMKPGNVVVLSRPNAALGAQEFVKLLDFGLSKILTDTDGPMITHTGMVMGTPRYMAPEQLVDARSVDHRADLWAVGVMLFEMLAGTHPFNVRGMEAMLSALAAQTPRSLRAAAPGVPTALVDVVDRALEREPSRRWPSARAFADALQAANVSASVSRTRIDKTLIDPEIGVSRLEPLSVPTAVEVANLAARGEITRLGRPDLPPAQAIAVAGAPPSPAFAAMAVTPGPAAPRTDPMPAAMMPSFSAPTSAKHAPVRGSHRWVIALASASLLAAAALGLYVVLNDASDSAGSDATATTTRGAGPGAPVATPGVSTSTGAVNGSPQLLTADPQDPSAVAQTGPTPPAAVAGSASFRSASGVLVTLVRTLGEIDRNQLAAAIESTFPALDACRAPAVRNVVGLMAIGNPLGGLLSVSPTSGATSDMIVGRCAARALRSAQGFPSGGGVMRFSVDLPAR